MTDGKRLSLFLKTQNHMILAVSLDDSSPWAVPLKIQARGEWYLEWDTRTDTVHSQAIDRNSRASITMFEKDDDAQMGFYLKCYAALIESHSDGIARYRATVEQAWINDETFIKREVSLS